MKIRCPDSCNYRPKDAPVCGFCLKKILNSVEVKVEKGGETLGQKNENQSAREDD